MTHDAPHISRPATQQPVGNGLSRRSFIIRSGMFGVAAATGMATGSLGSLLTRTSAVLAAPGNAAPHTFVCIFLRGGMDGLSALAPITDADYVAARPSVAIRAQRAIPLASGWGLHPALAPLIPAWDAGGLALIPASGSPDPSRSHFSAMDAMEAGTPGDLSTPMGWLARHVRSSHGLDPFASDAMAQPADPELLTTLAMGRMSPRSLRGYGGTVTIADLDAIGLRGDDGVLAALREMYGERVAWTSPVDGPGLAALDVLAELEGLDLGPAPDPDAYGQSQLGQDLAGVARLLDAGVPIEVVSADMGGWDLHQSMGDDTDGPMADRLDELGRALGGFWEHTADRRDDITVVVMSEFGRRVAENSSAGTDHGNGGLTMVLGGRTNGGIHGVWNGVGADVLDRGDVPLLNDYRQVLSEIIDRSLENGAHLGEVFPGFEYTATDALGIVR